MYYRSRAHSRLNVGVGLLHLWGVSALHSNSIASGGLAWSVALGLFDCIPPHQRALVRILWVSQVRLGADCGLPRDDADPAGNLYG